MESMVGNVDEQRGDAISEVEVEGGSQAAPMDDSLTDSRTDGAGVAAEENAVNDARTGSTVGWNGMRDGHEMDLPLRNRDVKLTMRLGDAVEDDARSVARSLNALLASLKSALSEVTGTSVEHLRTENEAAGEVQDAAIDAATKGNRFINACLRLNEEMRGMNRVAAQLETLKQRVDQFEYQSNRYLPRQ